MYTLSKQDGFTLIEALAAMAILTIGILTLYTLQITSIKGNATATRMTLASSIASDSYERLLQVPYNAPAMDAAAAANPHDFTTEFPGVPLPTRVSAVTWNVTDWASDGIDNDNADGDDDPTTGVDEGGEAGIKEVALLVNYIDKNTTKTMTMNFYKHELL